MKTSKLALGLIASGVVLFTATQQYAQLERRPPRVLSGFTDIVWSVKFSPDNRTLAIARGTSDAGRVELWDIVSGTLRRTIRGFDGAVWSISFASDGRTLVSGSGGFHRNKISEKPDQQTGIPFVELKWWDTETGELKQRVELPGDDRVSLIAIHSPDGGSLAAVEYRAAIALKTFDTFGGLRPGLTEPGMISIGRSLTYDADLRLLDASTGDVRLKFKGSLNIYESAYSRSAYRANELTYQGAMNNRGQPVAFSPDGHLVALWNTREVRLWNTSSGAEVRKLRDFKGHLSAVAFSPDGRILAAGITKLSFKNNRRDYKSEVRTWDVATGSEKKVMPVTTQYISSLVFALSGEQLLIGGTHRDDTGSVATLELADLETGSLGSLESRGEGNASSLVLSPDGRLVAVQTDASSLYLLETKNWKIKQAFNENSDISSRGMASRRFLVSVKSVMALAFSADGKTVSGEIEQGGIKLWNPGTGEVKKQLADQSDTGSMAASSLDGTILAEVAGNDGTLRLWNVTSGEKKSFSDADGPVSAIALSPDGHSLAVARPNLIVLLNTATGEAIQKLRVQTKVECLALSDRQTLATAGEDGTIQTWDLTSGLLTRTITGGGKITALRFAPAGRTLASATEDGRVSLWDLQTGSLRLQLKKHSAAVSAITFSADGKLMATGGNDRSVIIWETATGKARRTLKGHDLAVTSLAFSPDASLLASGAGNASVVLWDVPTGKLNRVLK
ncbi:MAG TPA: WD40 repeat domain-containing protein [Pyrinomonadaceae bacterium]|nr:WD40 repeat domain-containing protein [Pyrinomonadaceae bacterium]